LKLEREQPGQARKNPTEQALRGFKKV